MIDFSIVVFLTVSGVLWWLLFAAYIITHITHRYYLKHWRKWINCEICRDEQKMHYETSEMGK
ncbi:MAG TPA: hypothetical protein VJ327_02845 [Patescibacteria group bacterium]|nr:hypothetical protein [Patescibacteria group bacterium]